MKVMIDLNVVIDVVQERLPHYVASSAVLGKVLNKELSAVLPGHAVTTIHYLVAKYTTNKEAGDIVDWMLANFEVAAIDKDRLLRARSLPIAYFEDAVVASLAEASGCTYIISRNLTDFIASPIQVITADELLQMI